MQGLCQAFGLSAVLNLDSSIIRTRHNAWIPRNLEELVRKSGDGHTDTKQLGHPTGISAQLLELHSAVLPESKTTLQCEATNAWCRKSSRA